jgi:hypothetical protein
MPIVLVFSTNSVNSGLTLLAAMSLAARFTSPRSKGLHLGVTQGDMLGRIRNNMHYCI